MFFSFSQFVVSFSALHVRLCSFCSLSSSSGFPSLVFPSVPSLSPVCVLWLSFVPPSLYWLLSSPLLFWFFSPIRPQFFMGSAPLSTVFSCFRPPSFRLSVFFLFRLFFLFCSLCGPPQFVLSLLFVSMFFSSGYVFYSACGGGGGPPPPPSFVRGLLWLL